jgi:hypothetical protein
MKSLLEISRIITRKKLAHIEILDDSEAQQKHSKFNEFYRGILSNQFRSDQEAAETLYSCEPQDARYRQLKSRFRKRLLNTLFFLDLNKPSASNYEQAHYHAQKEWALINILRDQGAHYSAAQMSRQLLGVTQKYHLTNLRLNVLRFLREYALLEEDTTSFDAFEADLQQLLEQFQAEVQAESLFFRVQQIYLHPAAESRQQELLELCNELLGLSDRNNSPWIYFHMYQAWAMQYLIEKDAAAAIDICTQALAYLDTLPRFYPEEVWTRFYINQMAACLYLQDYKRGMEAAEKALPGLEAGSSSWFVFMEYYLLLAAHTEHYNHAMAIFNHVATSVQFYRRPATEQYKWRVVGSYIAACLKMQGMEDRVVRVKMKDNLLSIAVTETAGRSYQLLEDILGVIYHITDRQWAKADNALEKLRQWANRQAGSEHPVRQQLFIRSLQQLKKAKYQPLQVRQHTKYLQGLQSMPIYRAIPQQLEVIPYQHLWKLVTHWLETRP